VAIDFSITNRSKELVGPMSPAGIQGRDAAAIAPTPLGNVPKYAAAAKGGQDLRRRLSGLQHQREGYGRQRAMGLDDMSRRFGDMRRQVPGQFNQRGMLDSGQFQRGLGRTYTDELREAGRFEMGVQGALDDLASQQWGAEQAYAGQRMGGVMDDASRRAVLAAQIRNA
tara:strand:- start:342 stop:848 length:507 start_codon:yes stop_codon:yes gene_type:complete